LTRKDVFTSPAAVYSACYIEPAFVSAVHKCLGSGIPTHQKIP